MYKKRCYCGDLWCIIILVSTVCAGFILPKQFCAISNVVSTKSSMKLPKAADFFLQSTHLLSVAVIFLNDALRSVSVNVIRIDLGKDLDKIVLKFQMTFPLFKNRS